MAIELQPFKFSNYARSTLASAISASAGSLTLAEDDGDLFPDPAAPGEFEIESDGLVPLILWDRDAGVTEIVYGTAKDGDTFTIDRAKEGTTARAWPAGTEIINQVTAGFFQQQVAANGAPTTPGNQSGVLDTYDNFVITWDASTPFGDDTICRYDIYKDDDGYGFVYYASVDGDVLTYTDENVDLVYTDENLYYVIAVGCVGGESAAPAEAQWLSTLSETLIIFNEPNHRRGTAPSGSHDFEPTDGATYDRIIRGQGSNQGAMAIFPIEASELPAEGKVYLEYKQIGVSSRVNNGFQVRWGVGFGAHGFNPTTDAFTAGPGIDGWVLHDNFEDSGTNGRISPGDGTWNTYAGAEINLNGFGMMAIDFALQKVWFGANGSWIGPGTQNPATGEGGFWPNDDGSGWQDVTGCTPRPWFGLGLGLDDGEDIELRISEEYWNYTPPSGFGEWNFGHSLQSGRGSIPDWTNPSPSDYVLDNLTPGLAAYSMISSAGYHARGGKGHQTGKKYFEVYVLGDSGISELTPSLTRAGIIKGSESQLQALGNGGAGIGAYGDGIPRDASGNNGAYISGDGFQEVDARTGNFLASGDVWMFAVDFDNGIVYAGGNGVWFGGFDPTSGIGGRSFTVGGEDWYPALYQEFSVSCMYCNTGGIEFKESMPAGYSAWDD